MYTAVLFLYTCVFAQSQHQYIVVTNFKWTFLRSFVGLLALMVAHSHITRLACRAKISRYLVLPVTHFLRKQSIRKKKKKKKKKSATHKFKATSVKKST